MVQLSLGTEVWQMTSESPLSNSVNLWNLQTCGNEKNSPLVDVPRDTSCKVIKFACKEQSYVCPDRHGSSPPYTCSPFLRVTASSTTDKQAQLHWSLGLDWEDSAALGGLKPFLLFYILKCFFKGAKPFLTSA